MKKFFSIFLCFLLAFFTACSSPTTTPEATAAATVPTAEISIFPAPTEPETPPEPSEPETLPEPSEPVVELTEKEKRMLLKLGMAERGNEDCTECIALVMRTVLNRVESGRFGRNIYSVIFAPGQFTPVADGSYSYAEPNQRCYEALEMVIYGWDESQGALFYEWCEGESWHSKNLHLLFQHCNFRFYD